MSDPWLEELPAEWLDHLVLDMAELEMLAARLERSIGAIRPTEVPDGPLSVQILDVLTRVSDTTGALHKLAKGRLMSLATTMATASDSEEPAALPRIRTTASGAGLSAIGTEATRPLS